LAQSRAFRDAVARDLAKPLEPEKIAIAVASSELRPRIGGAPKGPPHPPGSGAGSGAGSAVVVQVDPNTYAQNNNANAVYGNNFVVGEAAVATDAGVEDDAAVPVDAGVAAPPPPRPTPRPAPRPAPPVTIVISALAWQTLPLDGEPALIAVRRVQTPDGAFAQGFVVDRAALVATRPGVSLEPAAADDPALEVAPGWQVRAAENPADVAAAAVAAVDIAHTFRVRFIAVALAAVLAASLIVVVVARAERLARERSQFAAAAAHELRTPLAGLQLYGDMLADGLGDPTKLRDYARRMSEEASRLGRVVSNVLGFSQLERGNLSVEAVPGALDAALRELAERVEPALDRAGVVLELEVADGLRARFDRDALVRIVGNLLDNAEKYSRGADDRTLQLSATEVGGGVELVVRDHGDGVAEPARLFRAFARGVTADGPAGLGLGLALSRSLARAMGGELSFRAPPDGPGAAFVLRLPAA
jgi:signal transduction histidine kinase